MALGELLGIGGLGYPVAEEPLVTLEGADDDAARGEEEEDIEEVFGGGVGAYHAALGEDAVLIEQHDACDNGEHGSIEDADAETLVLFVGHDLFLSFIGLQYILIGAAGEGHAVDQ